MQVQTQPSPWPCVAMLSCLLVFCLAIPRFWRHEATPVEPGVAEPPLGIVSTSNDAAQPTEHGSSGGGGDAMWGDGPVASYELIGVWSPPTIEELVAARVGALDVYTGFGSMSQPSDMLPPFAAPFGESASAKVVPQDATLLTPDPLVLAALEGIGQSFSNFSFTDSIPRMVRRSIDIYDAWMIDAQMASSNAAGRSTLRLVNPHDEEPLDQSVGRAPSLADSFSTQANGPRPGPSGKGFWFAPQTLIEQLERLARHPESSEWACETLEVLRAMLNRATFGPDESQHGLEALSDSAFEAARIAEATSDDRLRVELLRAHWALARRLDRWSAMRDIHIARRGAMRIASRGDLNVLFANRSAAEGESAPSETALAKTLEQYERHRDPRLAREVVAQQRSLESSAESLDQALAGAVERHYRNANVRVAVTGALLNRLIDRERKEMRPVRDRVAGAQIRGQAYTRSESRVDLVPAEGFWQLEIETQGVVESQTMADGGPARIYNRGETDFTARKLIVVDSEGVSLGTAEVDAVNHNRLVGVTTDYDWVPLVGAYTRDRALARYRTKRMHAKAEAESRVTRHASEMLDEQTLAAVNRIRDDLRARVTNRLKEHGIEITPIEMASDEQRIVARLRVAGEHQLGSHTPRPRALSDSLASVQIHETAFTNTAVTLGLDGGRFTAPELRDMLLEKFPGQAKNNAIEPNPATKFQFAERDAVTVHVSEGRLELAIALAAMQHDGRIMRDVVVHAYYVPVVSGLDAELARDGSLGIEGRISSGDRARLHNIFNSVLPPNRRLPILRMERLADGRLDGLMITQMVLEDGWIGLAIGPADPERVAERSRSLR